MGTLNIPLLCRRSKKISLNYCHLLPNMDAMISPQWLEQPISRTNFFGPKDVRHIEVLLYLAHKKKRICFQEENILSCYSRPFFRRNKINRDRVTSPESVFIPLTKTCITNASWQNLHLHLRSLLVKAYKEQADKHGYNQGRSQSLNVALLKHRLRTVCHRMPSQSKHRQH